MKTISFSKPEPHIVVLRVSRAILFERYLVGICYMIFMGLLVMGVILNLQEHIDFKIIFVTVLLIASIASTVYGVVGFRKTSVAGNKYSFDTAAKTVFCNNRRAAGFDDIQKIQLEKIVDDYENTTVDYLVDLICRNGCKDIHIENFKNREEALYVTRELSNILGNTNVEMKPENL